MIRPSSTRPIFRIDKTNGTIAPSEGGQIITVTVNQAVGQLDPTSTYPILFDVVFSAPVTGFTAADVVISGTAGAASCVVTGSGAEYTVAVYPGVEVTINQAPGQDDPTSASPILFDVEFSEPVTGFTGADVVLTGPTGVSECEVSGSGTVYTVSVPMLDAFSILGSVTGTQLNGARDVVVDGNYAYVAAEVYNGVTVVDISDPSSPTIVASVTSSSLLDDAYSVEKVGNYLYATAWLSNSFVVIDVSTPTSPAIVGSVVNATTLNTPIHAVIDGNYAYVCAVNASRLTIINITNPAAPAIVGSVPAGQPLWRGAKAGNYMFCTAVNGDSVTVIDVTNPASPSVVTTFTDSQLDGAYDIFIDRYEVYAYVTAQNSNRLVVIDIYAPASLTIAGSVQDNVNLDGARGVVIDGTYAYVCALDTDRLTRVDIMDPTNPVVLDSLSATAFDAIVGLGISGSKLYAASNNADSLVIVETFFSSGAVIANIPAGVVTSSVTGTGNVASTSTDNSVVWEASPYVSAFGPFFMTLIGDLLAVGGTTDPDAVVVFDVSDPEFPVERGSFVYPADVNALAPTATDGVYLFNYGQSLTPPITYNARVDIIDIVSDPDNPVLIGQYTESGVNSNPAGVCWIGGTVIATAWHNQARVRMIDYSTPSTPVSIGSVVEATHLDGVRQLTMVATNLLAARGSHNFFGTIRPTFALIDVSVPASPTIVGVMPSGILFGIQSVYDMQPLNSSTMFISTFADNSVLTVDISNPTTPTITNVFTDPLINGAYDMTLLSNGNLVLASNFNGYVLTLDITDPNDPSLIASVRHLDPTDPVEVDGRVIVASQDLDRLTSMPISLFT